MWLLERLQGKCLRRTTVDHEKFLLSTLRSGELKTDEMAMHDFILSTIDLQRKLLFRTPMDRNYVIDCRFCLALSQTSPGFYVSALQVF